LFNRLFVGLLALGFWLLAALTEVENFFQQGKLPEAIGQKPEADYF
jgi:hypothetical protein